MKEGYDFSKGVRGKFFRKAAMLKIPVYLEPEVQRFLSPGGHLKLPHLWAGQTPPPDGVGTRDDYVV